MAIWCAHTVVSVEKSIVFGGQSYIDDEYTHNHATESEFPEWMLLRDSLGDVWKDIKISELVDHWNVYIQLGEDELVRVKQFCSWMKRRASNENRVAAGFIFQYMLTKADLSTNVNSFPTIVYEKQKPLSTCEKCNEIFFRQLFYIKT